MTSRSDIEHVLDRYLAEGAEQVPDRVIDAALDQIEHSKQRRALRAPWRSQEMPSFFKIALAGAAVVAVLVVGGMFLTRAPTPSVAGPAAGTPSPIASTEASATAPPESAAPSTTLRMTERFDSKLYGYSIGHPADWTPRPAADLWYPEDWDRTDEPFDFVSLGQVLDFRAASAVIPNGASVDEWIMQYMTMTDEPTCGPPRNTLEEILIDGHRGRLRDNCGEVEATVVVGDRVYLFTYYVGSGVDPEPSRGRPVFDAFAATIQLTPETAEVPPSPAPS
jgi:hypothetical protein